MRRLFLVFAVLAGCPDDVEILEFTDEGQLCWSSGDLVVDFETCLSSSCDTLTDAECTATLDNGTLTIESYGRIESKKTNCTDDCRFAFASCTLPAIEDPATVTVQHGTTTVGLDAIEDCTLF